ncbi:hypothetical protein [Amycolatopsis kentuckyensis]|uniref:hypothetical protein n=1 Tax=Amycolatopsis kentuckyensis TaxID=218823 RepID=UPI0035684C1D
MKSRGDSPKSRRGGGSRRFAATQFLWLGPGEVVVLDVLRTGRVGVGSVLLWLVVTAGALVPVPELRLGVRAGADLVARLLFLPARGWSVAVVLLDVVVLARAWYSAGRPRRDGDVR